MGSASPSEREVATGLPGWQIKLPDRENYICLMRASPSQREVATGLPGWQICLPDSENCHMFGESLSLTEGSGNRAASLADKVT